MRNSAAALAVFLVVALGPDPAEPDDTLGAFEVMERVDARDRGRSESSLMEMTLIARSGEERPRRLDSWRFEDETTRHTLLRFTNPADLRQTALLTHDHIGPDVADDQWIFLPALRSLKRVAQSDQRSSFVGSDFSYADLTRQELERYTYRFTDEAGDDGLTWSIEALPDAQEVERTGYRRSVLRVSRANFVVVAATHWLEDSSRTKHFQVGRLEQIDGIWVALETEMATREGDALLHRTTVRLSDVQLNVDIDARRFRPNRVARGD